MIDLAPITINEMDYDQAWMHCLTLEYNEHKDWRLPTHDEYIHNDGVHALSWYEDQSGTATWYCHPVRDKND